MLTKDYIMRMVETLSMALQKILLMKEAKNISAGYMELDKTSNELLGFELNLLQSLPYGKIIELFSIEKDTAAPRLYALGVLLNEKADLLLLQGDAGYCRDLKIKALRIFIESFMLGQKPVYKNHADMIDGLLVQNNDIVLPADIRGRLFIFYEVTGQFSKAEDILFELKEEDISYISKGIDFYERLLQLDDDALIKGNLPRKEVLEAYHEFNGFKNSLPF